MIRPVGVGLISRSPTGVVGIHHHDIAAAPSGLDRHLLGHELGALVVADHVFQAHRRILVGGAAVAGETHGRDARGVHDSPHAGLPGSIKQRPRALDVGAIHDCMSADRASTAGNRRQRETPRRSPPSPCAANRDRADRRPRARHAGRRCFWSAGGSHQQPQIGALVGQSRATWLPTKPVAPVTNAFIESGVLFQLFRLQRNVLLPSRLSLPVLPHPGFPTLARRPCRDR